MAMTGCKTGDLKYMVMIGRLCYAQTLFSDTNIQIPCEGQCHLGAAIGTRSFTESYVSKKINRR